MLRVLKLFKLAKLLRMLKASRSIKALQEYFQFSNASTALLTHLAAFFMTIHWIACLWGLTTLGGAPCWIDQAGLRYVDEKTGVKHLPGIGSLYMLCLYFSVNAMVMGENETTMPATDLDRCMACLCMLF